MSRSRSSDPRRRRPVSPGSGGVEIAYTGWPGRSSRGRGMRRRARAELVHGTLLADHHPRTHLRRGVGEHGAAAHRTGRRSRRRDRAPRRPPRPEATNRPSPRRATSSRNTRSTGSREQNARICVASARSCLAHHQHRAIHRDGSRVRAMPIHVRAEPGDYADAVLLPGTRCARSTSRRRISTTSSSGTASAGCSATRGK